MFSVTAAAHTNLITLDPDDQTMPVVGWFWGADGHIKPMIFGRTAGLVTGEAIEFPNGLVVDPATRAAYESAEVWRDAIEADEPYSPGVAVFKHPIETDFFPVQPRTEAAPAEAFAFTGKTFAKTSFWRVGNRVLTLAPENPAPVGADVLKITRDAFVELRKTLAEASLEELMGTGEVVAEPEDDDGDDLI